MQTVEHRDDRVGAPADLNLYDNALAHQPPATLLPQGRRARLCNALACIRCAALDDLGDLAESWRRPGRTFRTYGYKRPKPLDVSRCRSSLTSAPLTAALSSSY